MISIIPKKRDEVKMEVEKMFGYNGKILRINLTTGQIKIEEPGEKFFRTYIGGAALGAYYLLRDMKAGIDPLSPDNILVAASSVVGGAPVPGYSRVAVMAKSPMTGGIGDSQAGGFWAPELKKAGYEAVIVEGKAEKPVYIWIKDDVVRIKSAEHLWGKDTSEAQMIIRNENNAPSARNLIIGKAGENMVKFACVVNDLTHVNARTGMGAVMGSKNLKSITVVGTKRIEFQNKDKVISMAKEFAANYKSSPDIRESSQNGTAYYVMGNQVSGMLPTNNFDTLVFEEAEKISAEAIHDTIFMGMEGCYACPVNCKNIVKSDGKWKINPDYGAPEYETIAALGSNCGIGDIEAICKGNEICNKTTMDTISTGVAISFAMKCFEQGILTKEDTGGLEIRFGDSDVMVKLCEMIANREGFGNVLAQGSLGAARIIGKESEKYAMQVKGNDFPMHDPRTKGMLGFSYAFNPTGADHITCEHDTCYTEGADYFLNLIKPLGLLDSLEAASIEDEKVRMFYYLQKVYSLYDSLGICIFTVAPARYFTFTKVIETINAITGWETSLFELMKVGERKVNMAKLFNLREGFTKEDDRLPEKMFEPVESGPTAGNKIDKKHFYKQRDLYYEMMNWNEEGIPRRGKLVELNIQEVIEYCPEIKFL